MATLPPPGRNLPPGGRPGPGGANDPGAKKPNAGQTQVFHAIKPLPVQPGGAAKPGGTTQLPPMGGPKPANDMPGKVTLTPGKLDPSKLMGIPPGAGQPSMTRAATGNGPSATATMTMPAINRNPTTSPTPTLPSSIKTGPPSTPSSPEAKPQPQPIKLPALNINPKANVPSSEDPPAAGHSRTPSDMGKKPQKPPGPNAGAPTSSEVCATNTSPAQPKPKPLTTPTPDKVPTVPKVPSTLPGPLNMKPVTTTTTQSGMNFAPSSPTHAQPPPSLDSHSPPVGRVPISQRAFPSVVLEPPRRMTRDVSASVQAPRPAPAPVMAPRPQDSKDEGANPNETKEEKKERMRKKVSVELRDTEDSYVTSLRQLDSIYIEPLRTLAGGTGAVVSTAEANTLFSNISQIRELNNKFLSDLNKRIEVWTNQTCVCDLVRDFAPYFKMYTQYVSNYSTASDLLQQLEKRAAFQTFAAEKQAAGNAALSFYLIMPIQRIPRYKLLLQEIQKYTDDAHDDKKACDEALAVVSAVALRINEEVKLYESRQKIMEIQSNFAGNVDFVSPSRRFIRQGQLTKICRATTKVYTFFCFNDLLVYADVSLVQKVSLGPTVKRYKLHRQIPIDSSFGIQDMSDDVKFHHRFTIINAQKSFVVFAPSKEEKAQWFKDLSGCMSEFRRATGTKNSTEKASAKHIAPVWQTDSSAKQCQCCKAAFSLIKRRHHCRYCGNLVCEQCSTKRMKVNTKKEPLRVCDHCVAQIKGEALPKPVPDKATLTQETGPEPSSKTGGEYEVESDEEEVEHQGDGVKAVALHAFEAMMATDLAFQQGDVIWVTNQKDPGWWEGTLNGKTGVFPANYVAIEGVGPAVESVPIDISMVCNVPYTHQNGTELSMLVGDAIQCTAKEGVLGGNGESTEEWYYGCNARTGLEGWFPGSCVSEA